LTHHDASQRSLHHQRGRDDDGAGADEFTAAGGELEHDTGDLAAVVPELVESRCKLARVGHEASGALREVADDAFGFAADLHDHAFDWPELAGGCHELSAVHRGLG
jgi:hypothetical protein